MDEGIGISEVVADLIRKLSDLKIMESVYSLVELFNIIESGKRNKVAYVLILRHVIVNLFNLSLIVIAVFLL